MTMLQLRINRMQNKRVVADNSDDGSPCCSSPEYDTPRKSLSKKRGAAHASSPIIRKGPISKSSSRHSFSSQATAATEASSLASSTEFTLSPKESSTNTKKVTDTRKVTWCKQVRAKNHLHTDDFTAEERQATWYSSKEVTAIRKEIREIAHMYDNGDVRSCSELHIRGIECRTRSGMERRIKNRVAAVRCVLDEQERQSAMDDFDPEYLSLIYRDTCSSLCAYEAIKIAKQDEAEAMEQALR